jgi:hypothetical protein
VTDSSPVVSVPVLSKTMAVRFRAVSRSVTFLTSTPSRLAADSAATFAVGVARIRAHGQPMISSEITRSMSLVKKNTIRLIISTTGVYHVA